MNCLQGDNIINGKLAKSKEIEARVSYIISLVCYCPANKMLGGQFTHQYVFPECNPRYLRLTVCICPLGTKFVFIVKEKAVYSQDQGLLDSERLQNSMFIFTILRDTSMVGETYQMTLSNFKSSKVPIFKFHDQTQPQWTLIQT